MKVTMYAVEESFGLIPEGPNLYPTEKEAEDALIESIKAAGCDLADTVSATQYVTDDEEDTSEDDLSEAEAEAWLRGQGFVTDGNKYEWRAYEMEIEVALPEATEKLIDAARDMRKALEVSALADNGWDDDVVARVEAVAAAVQEI